MQSNQRRPPMLKAVTAEKWRIPGSEFAVACGGQVLLLSMRRLSNLVANATQYEFEDTVRALTGADRVEVDNEAALEYARRTYKLLRMTSGSRKLARRFARPPSTQRLERDYELFFPIFNDPHELYALSTIPNWRARCRVAVCFICEVWVHLLPKYLLELLAEFDHVFIGMRHSVDDVARIVGRPCSYLPGAADVLKFSPWPEMPPRSIDVMNIGRRSAMTHDGLLELAKARQIFYYYDTFAGGSQRQQRTFRVDRPDSHRLLLANLLKRSRYYIANRSRVNQPEYTGKNEEISGRFYEGAAAGAVMIGEAPNTPDFASQFNWPDAVLPLPFDSTDVASRLAQFDHDADRLARIRRDNVCNAALRHDWVHRLSTVFAAVGVPPTDAMRDRQERLKELAAGVAATG
jgi:hypothetical protein